MSPGSSPALRRGAGSRKNHEPSARDRFGSNDSQPRPGTHRRADRPPRRQELLRGLDVYSMGPPSFSGSTVGEPLNILEASAWPGRPDAGAAPVSGGVALLVCRPQHLPSRRRLRRCAAHWIAVRRVRRRAPLLRSRYAAAAAARWSSSLQSTRDRMPALPEAMAGYGQLVGHVEGTRALTGWKQGCLFVEATVAPSPGGIGQRWVSGLSPHERRVRAGVRYGYPIKRASTGSVHRR
jgi:hypothetical protein